MRDAAATAALFGAPMAMRRTAFDSLLATLTPRLALMDSGQTPAVSNPTPRAMSSGMLRRLPGGAWDAGDGIAVLPIVGPLMRRASWLTDACGFPTYQDITDTLVELAMTGSVRGILLDIDSPGGEANGCFDTAEFIRKFSPQTGIPIWAIANEEACSAAYAMASSAKVIWVPRTGEVGSIGVICAHIDQSGWDAAKGFKWTYVFAGEQKSAFNPHEPLTATALQDAQRDVDKLYGMFVAQVAKFRGIGPDAVRGTRARIFRGTEAVKVRLADRVGTFDECLNAFAAELSK